MIVITINVNFFGSLINPVHNNIRFIFLPLTLVAGVAKKLLTSSLVHIDSFTQRQSLFFPLDRTKKVYSGEHSFSLGFKSAGSTWDGVTYPDTVKLSVEVGSRGALEGEYSTPRYGESIVGQDGWPSTEFSYKAKLMPKIYDSSLSGANLVLDLSYNTEVSPTGHGDDILDAEASESIEVTTITQETSYIQNIG